MNKKDVCGYKQDIVSFLLDGKDWNDSQKLVLNNSMYLLNNFFDELLASAETQEDKQ
jgi:hypothetical protein